MDLRICPSCELAFNDRWECARCGGPLVLATPELFLGKTFGKYRLESVLGRGGMGVVFLAQHETLLRKVALKLILPQRDDEEYRQRFLREARVLAGIHHPNVVEIYDFDVTTWGLPFYVMEYLEGRTLRGLLEERGQFAPRDLLPILRQIGAGLQGVHRKGIVHRDLKPENIFLATFEGGEIVKVLDFGIAKGPDFGEDGTLTRTGAVVGTVHYLAPEQLLGEAVSPQTDQYAVALMVAELLTGRAVRAGKTLPQIVATEIGAPVSVPALETTFPALAGVIERATRPDPADRFPHMDSFVEAAGAALADSEADSGATIHLSGGGRTTRRRSRATAAVGRKKGASRTRHILLALAGTAAAAAMVIGLTGRFRGTAAGTSPHGLLAPSKSIPVPVDARSIAAVRGNVLALSGADGVLFAQVGSDRPPGRMHVAPADVLGSTPEGDLVVRRGDTVDIVWDPGSEASPLGTGVPATGPLLSSPDSRWIAAPDERGATVWRLQGSRYVEAFRAAPGFRPEAVAVGNRSLAMVGGRRLILWSLRRGAITFQHPIGETGVDAVAIDDFSGTVAVGGWFDAVHVIDPETGETWAIRRRQGAGRELALQFLALASGTALAVGEAGGVTLWEAGRGIVARWDRPEAQIADLHPGLGGLLALDAASHTVFQLSLDGISSLQEIRFGEASPWAAVAGPGGSHVLVGDERGVLSDISLGDGSVRHVTVHTQGITSLVTDGTRLASASDDRTIAVWHLPGLNVEWRSRAHDFLINRLFLQADRGVLWSSSSDGRVKRWSWPDLDELETIDVGAIVHRKVALHALWVAPDQRRIVLGTWNRLLISLTRSDGGSWAGRAVPFPSLAGYQLAGLGSLHALLVVGYGQPTELAVYDLSRNRLLPLRRGTGPLLCAVILDGGRRALVFGANRILDYRFERGSGGTLRYRVAAIRHRDLGTAYVATPLPNGRIAVGNEAGILHVLDLQALHGAWLCNAPAGG